MILRYTSHRPLVSGRFAWFLSALLMLGAVGVTVGLAVGVFSRSFQEAQDGLSLLFLPMALFSGCAC